MQQQGDKRYRELLGYSLQNLRTSQDGFKAIKIKRYAFVLAQALSAQGVKEIDLSKNSLVQDKQVDTILKRSPLLETLNIHDCSQLTGQKWLNAKLFQYHPTLKLDIRGTPLEDDAFWNSEERSQHVLSWTKPRKIFLEQFKLWEQRGWDLLESQPFNLSLTGPEEDFLAERIRSDEALRKYLVTPLSIREIWDKGLLWLEHPLLRYQWFCNIVRVLSGNKILSPLTFKNPTKMPYDYLAKIILIGDTNVGKSSILVRYAHDFYKKTFIVTIGVDFKIRTLQLRDGTTIKLQIWDTAGCERFKTITTAYYRGAMGFFIVFDVTDERSFENIRHWMRCVEQHACEGVPIILLANKWDMTHHNLFHEREHLLDELCKEYGFIGWFKTSAELNIGIDKAVFTLVNAIAARMKWTDSSGHIIGNKRLSQHYSTVLEKARQLNSWPHIAKTMQSLLSLNKDFYAKKQSSVMKNELLSFKKDFAWGGLDGNESEEIEDVALGTTDESEAGKSEKTLPEKAENLPSVFKEEVQKKHTKSLDDLSLIKKYGHRFFITSQNDEKKGLKLKSTGKIMTLGNGNCLFNAVGLGLCDLIIENKLSVLPGRFFAMAMKNDKLLFWNELGFKEWIANRNFNQKQEKLSLPLLLRRLAIRYIKTHYENYRDQFENILRGLFQQRNEKNPPDENHFLEHEFIRNQILYFVETEEELIDWWQRGGKDQYFSGMKEPAANSQDKKQWGGDIELDAIARYLGIRIIYHKKPAKGRPLGILGGLVPILREGEKREGIYFTEEDTALLKSLDFGCRWGNYFHLEIEFFEKLEKYQSLSKQGKVLLYWFLDNNNLNLPVTVEELKELGQEEVVFTEQEYQAFLSCLQARGIVKQKGDKNINFITQDSDGKVVDKERILQKMGDISEGLRAKLVLLSENKVPEFEVVFGDNHWEYLPSQDNVSCNQPYKKSHIISARRQSF